MSYETSLSLCKTDAPQNEIDDVEGAPVPAASMSGRVAGQGPSAPVKVNLASVDLNLLVALEALLDQRNVTHAAHRVGLSQPAMSRSLSRLRFMFSDDLLVRTSTGLVRTKRGEELFKRLPPLLSTMRELVACRYFTPEQWQSTVRVAMTDHQALVLLMPLLERLSARACHIDLVTEPLVRGTLKRLETGEIEFAIGQVNSARSGFYRRTLYVEPYLCLLRNDHPALAQEMTQESFYALRHAVIAPAEDDEFGEVYDALARLLPGRNRVVIPSVVATPMMLAETDLALTVPLRMARKMVRILPLTAVGLPIEVPPHEVTLLWHERNHRNTEHAWMRAEIVATVAGIG